jgi:two-component system sensor histidine kinase KdpD
MPNAYPRTARWLVALVLLGLVVVALVPYRERLDQVESVVPLLIVVLVGSALGGRALGFSLALLGFAAIDYFFQPPFDTLAVHKGSDWIVLLAFLVAAGVATQLLARAQAAADAAQRRAAEVERLAEIGAETLAAGRAEESLHATADIVRRTLDLSRCDIFVADVAGPRWAAGAGRGADDGPPNDLDALAAARSVLHDGRLFNDTSNGATTQLAATLVDPTFGTRVETYVPLQSHHETVGVLRLVADGGRLLDESQRSFLAAITHYAALAAERVRLVADAEHAAALREADRMKDFVVASLSHDLQTPLTAIKTLAHTAAERGDADAAVIVEQVDRLTRMVANVLDFSRARSGAMPMTLELNAVEDLVGAAVRQTRALFSGRRLDRHLDAADDVLVGRFDFVASLRVLGNLLENAAKYAPKDQPVDLRVRRDGEFLLLEVADRGPGVPESERQRIFTPFYRSQRAPADVGGVGLGLAVASALAQAQGGSLAYRPRENGGAVFTFRLPAADVVPDEIDASDSEVGDARAAAP